MENFADRMLGAIKRKGNPCVVGLDPRLDLMPEFAIAAESKAVGMEEAVHRSIVKYNACIIDAVSDLVPGVKLQSAFYEQYGIGGMRALMDTVGYAKGRGLVVIIDAKRNDIASTAEAYANAFLGRSSIFGDATPVINADCITVSPYLGSGSLGPFVDACRAYGKGIFILVKTSNPDSTDIQNLLLDDGKEVYTKVAEMVNAYSSGLIGDSGYSAIGAVVGATFPEEARRLRKMMPRSLFLVPGYGSQGGTAADAAECFNEDGFGAVVNASRSLTYSLSSREVSEAQAKNEIRDKAKLMIADINGAIVAKRK